MQFRNRRPSLPTGAGLVVFLIVAAILAVALSRVIALLVHLVFTVAGYALAFVIAVALLSAARNRLTRTRALDRPRWRRESDGRRRY